MTHYFKDVSIFWDYGSCPAPIDSSGYGVVNKIRSLALRLGPIRSFKAYLPVSDHNSLASNGRALTLRSELQSSGVSLTDVPGRKDVADRMLIVDMLTHAFTSKPEPQSNDNGITLLISGDTHFSYALSTLRMRNHRVVLLGTGLEDVNASMGSQGDLCLDWESEIMGGAPRASSMASKSDSRSAAGNSTNARSTSGSPNLSEETSAGQNHTTAAQLVRAPADSQTSKSLSASTSKQSSAGSTPSESANGVPSKKSLPVMMETGVQTNMFKEAESQATQPIAIQQTTIQTTSPPHSKSPHLPEGVKIEIIEEHSVKGSEGNSAEAPSHLPKSIIEEKQVLPPPDKTLKTEPPLPLWSKEPDKLYTLEDWSPLPPPLETPAPTISSVSSPTIASSSQGSKSYLESAKLHIMQDPPAYSTTSSSPAPPPASPLEAAKLLAKPKVEPVIPPQFKPLVEVLRQWRAKGVHRPLRGSIAQDIMQTYPSAYTNAGVTRFSQYTALAAEKKIVELGGEPRTEWMRLIPW